METYEKYLKHKEDCPITVTGDLETTTGYISEIECRSIFATSYVLMFNLQPKLNMTRIIRLRSFGQSEDELKHITIPEKFCKYINHNDKTCFADACNRVLKKEEMQGISLLCMIQLWMIYRELRKYFDAVVKNYELTEKEKQNFQIFSENCPRDKKSTRCYICEFPLKSNLLRNFDTP